MCELTKKLDEIAQELIKQEHKQIKQSQTEEDCMTFFNAYVTIQAHAEYLRRTVGLTP